MQLRQVLGRPGIFAVEDLVVYADRHQRHGTDDLAVLERSVSHDALAVSLLSNRYLLHRVTLASAARVLRSAARRI